MGTTERSADQSSGKTSGSEKYEGVWAWLISILFLISFLCMLTGIGALIQVGFLGSIAAAGLSSTFPPIAAWLAVNIVAPLGTQLILILTGITAWLSAGLLAELMEPHVWKTRIDENRKQIQTNVVKRQGFVNIWREKAQDNNLIGSYNNFYQYYLRPNPVFLKTDTHEYFVPKLSIALPYCAFLLAADLISLALSPLTLLLLGRIASIRLNHKTTTFFQLVSAIMGDLVSTLAFCLEMAFNPFALVLSAYDAVKNTLHMLFDFFGYCFSEENSELSPGIIQFFKGLVTIPLFIAIEVPFTFLSKMVINFHQGWNRNIGSLKGKDELEGRLSVLTQSDGDKTSSNALTTAHLNPPGTDSQQHLINEQGTQQGAEQQQGPSNGFGKDSTKTT